MIKALLWDLDNTLLDFFQAEAYSLNERFHEFGLGSCSEDMARRFDAINVAFWQEIERGTLTRSEALNGRFEVFFKNEGISFTQYEAFNEAFERGLADEVFYVEDSYATIQALKGKYCLLAVTNGAEDVQNIRVAKSGFDKLFDGVFISETVGFEKPSTAFFEAALNGIQFNKSEMMIIGDSLTSDMRGGNNIGIKTCWYNPYETKNDKGVHIDYEIHSLKEIFEVLKRLEP